MTEFLTLLEKTGNIWTAIAIIEAGAIWGGFWYMYKNTVPKDILTEQVELAKTVEESSKEVIGLINRLAQAIERLTVIVNERLPRA